MTAPTTTREETTVPRKDDPSIPKLLSLPAAAKRLGLTRAGMWWNVDVGNIPARVIETAPGQRPFIVVRADEVERLRKTMKAAKQAKEAKEAEAVSPTGFVARVISGATVHVVVAEEDTGEVLARLPMTAKNATRAVVERELIAGGWEVVRFTPREGRISRNWSVRRLG